MGFTVVIKPIEVKHRPEPILIKPGKSFAKMLRQFGSTVCPNDSRVNVNALRKTQLAMFL